MSGTTSFETMRSQHLPRQDAGAARDASRAAGIRIDCDDMCAAALSDVDLLLRQASMEDAEHG